MLMDGCVIGQFGVKCSGHDTPLAYQHRMAGVFGEHFNSLPPGFDNRRANEYHLERFLAQFRFAHVNVACELAAVAVSQNGYVEKAERRLRRAVHLSREQDGAGTRAEKRTAV